MEVKLEYLKFYAETERRNGQTPSQIYQKIIAAWGQDLISLRSVQIWCKSASSGEDISFTHREGAGRPKTSRTEENVAEVKDLVTHCPHLCVKEMAELFDISGTSVQGILTEDLGLTSVIVRWVPHLLNDKQKEARCALARNSLKILRERDIRRRLIVIYVKWIYHRTVGTKNVNRH